MSRDRLLTGASSMRNYENCVCVSAIMIYTWSNLESEAPRWPVDISISEANETPCCRAFANHMTKDVCNITLQRRQGHGGRCQGVERIRKLTHCDGRAWGVYARRVMIFRVSCYKKKLFIFPPWNLRENTDTAPPSQTPTDRVVLWRKFSHLRSRSSARYFLFSRVPKKHPMLM